MLEAHTWSLMTAYNRVGGVYCSEHPLIEELVKREWGFDGVVMSDWYGTHSTVPAALAGLDLEMPGPAQWFGSHLADAVRGGRGQPGDPRRQGAPGAVAARPDGWARHARLRSRTVDRRPRRPGRRAPGRDRELCPVAQRQRHPAARPVARGRGPPAAARGDRSERRGRHDPRGGSACVSQFRRSRRWPVSGTASATPFASSTSAAARSFQQTPVLDASVLDGPLEIAYYAGRERSGEPGWSSTVTAPGSRSPGRSLPRCPRSSRCASRERWSRPDRRVDLRAGPDRPGAADDRRHARGRQLGADRA